jgi:hypothetical protein
MTELGDLTVFKDEKSKEVTRFFLLFCLVKDGYGSGSKPLTNVSGSRRPKNKRIRRIRIRIRNFQMNRTVCGVQNGTNHNFWYGRLTRIVHTSIQVHKEIKEIKQSTMWHNSMVFFNKVWYLCKPARHGHQHWDTP